jgi:hypothetical protein
MILMRGLLLLAAAVFVFAILGERVNRLVYGRPGKPRGHANVVAAIAGVSVAVVWLVGWALALTMLPEQTGRWASLAVSVSSVSILNGLRSDFATERGEASGG